MELLTLIRNPRSRDQGFRRLLEQYQERLYWHIRRMVLDHEDANDVLQDVCIKAYRGIEKFKGDARLYTWLYRIASNEAITFLKKKKRKQTEKMDDPDTSLASHLAADPYFDGNEAQVRLQEALQVLPNKQRLVFQMRYYDEMSYKEISEVLSTSVGALKASFHHATKKVESHLKKTML